MRKQPPFDEVRIAHGLFQRHNDCCAAIGGGTIRLSVGLETLDDLIWDLERGLSAASTAHVDGKAMEVPA